MSADFVQGDAFMTVSTPLGADKLLLDALEATEGLSELFRLTLHMRSQDAGLSAADVVGQPVSVKLALKDGPERHFHGVAARFAYTGSDGQFAHYSAEVVPGAWLLTLTRNRAIYQAKSVPQIVKAVLQAAQVTVSDKLAGSYPALEYCVQYDESGFDFISRLMEDAGIFYWFTFAEGSHTLVLADAASAHQDCPGAKTVRYFPDNGPRHVIDTIATLAVEQRLVSKEQVVDGFDPLKPATALRASASGEVGSGEAYEWPGRHADAEAGKALAQQWLQAAQAAHELLRGDGYAYPFAAGTRFTLTGHPREALNAAHVLRRVHHSARHGLYRNTFEAFPASVPFRAPRLTPRPRVAGSQTALVVGPSGEKIWTDQHGRIKVRFHWDRLGKDDDTCSCWVRVSQSVAGAGFGTLFLPHVGQEVVVSCIDGDPDRPLVTGCVYNGSHDTPAKLPDNQTQSVITTRANKDGGVGNEIRLDDKQDAELFYMHAPKDMKVEVFNDLAVTLAEGSQALTVEKGDRTVSVKTGKETHSVKGERALDIEGDESHANKAAFKHTVGGNYTLKVDGDIVIEAGGKITFKSSADASIKSGTALACEAGTSLTLKSGTSLGGEAGTSLALKAGTSLSCEATTSLSAKGSVQATVEGATTTVKGSAMMTLDGGGMLMAKGGLVKIN